MLVLLQQDSIIALFVLYVTEVFAVVCSIITDTRLVDLLFFP